MQDNILEIDANKRDLIFAIKELTFQGRNRKKKYNQT